MKKLSYGLLAIVLLALSFSWQVTRNSVKDDLIDQSVYDTCQAARMEVNGETEAHCGQVQDTFNREYLCQYNNRSAENRCWVERK